MPNTLAATIAELSKKYANTPLVARLDDAATLGGIQSKFDCWVRDSDDIVNIVWSNGKAIFDVTWLPTSEHAVLNVLPLEQVTGFEIREGPNVAAMLYGISGDFLVRIITLSDSATLGWAASTPTDAASLRAFAIPLLRDLAS